MRRIRWTAPAADDLENIKSYLDEHFPSFSEPTIRTIFRRVLTLKSKPFLGREGHRSGTSELVLTPLPYVVVYRVKQDAVEILHVHGAQNWR